MSLKVFSIVCISAALAVPQMRAGEKPPAAAALGQMESILDSCAAAAKPEDAESYKKQRAKLTEGVPEKEVTKIRDSEEYKQAYDESHDRFDHASSDEVNKACRVFLGHK